mmetsp:Transcript_27775/g.56926  ORF Transcript_27775/g.56926 Transcript_27775/m.56926 type:complete len:109 (-) Transcript_27775:50-376(-)
MAHLVEPIAGLSLKRIALSISGTFYEEGKLLKHETKSSLLTQGRRCLAHKMGGTFSFLFVQTFGGYIAQENYWGSITNKLVERFPSSHAATYPRIFRSFLRAFSDICG